MIREMLQQVSKEMLAALAVSLAIMVLFFALAFPGARRTGQLTTMARTWFESVGSGRTDIAYDLLAPSYRASFGRESFRFSMSASPQLRGFRSFHRTESELAKDRASVEGELRTDAGQFEATVHFARIEEPGSRDSWYVTEVLVNGAALLPR